MKRIVWKQTVTHDKYIQNLIPNERNGNESSGVVPLEILGLSGEVGDISKIRW